MATISDANKRLISAAVGAAFFVIVMMLPAVYFNTAFILATAALTYEIGKAFRFDAVIAWITVAAGAVLSTIAVYLNEYLFLGIFIYTTVIVLISLLKPKKESINQIMQGVFAVVYVSIFTSFLPKTMESFTFGKYTLILIFICAWLSDSGAYFVGRAFGKHKLIESVSPKKTVEGAIGGVITSIVACVVYGLCLNLILDINANYVLLAIIGGIGAILGQMGDLVASMIKREYDIKDYGNIMPGHGGLMDRFDSVIMVAPFVYYIIRIFGEVLS